MPLPPKFVPAQIQDTYVCAGHGIWDPADGRFALPNNVMMLFWVHHGEQLTHGVKLEDLVLKIDPDQLPTLGYNRDPSTLATARHLMAFESRPTAAAAAEAVTRHPGDALDPPVMRTPVDRTNLPPAPTRPRSRAGLPEVITGGGACYNYQLEADGIISMNVTMQKINILGMDIDPPYPADNVITIEPFGSPRLLKDIIASINPVGGRQIQVHWAACRSILR